MMDVIIFDIYLYSLGGKIVVLNRKILVVVKEDLVLKYIG